MRISAFLILVGLTTAAFAQDAYEPDNSVNQARMIAAPLIERNHDFHTPDDADWYRFTINDDRAVRVIARLASGLLPVYLYDAELNQLASTNRLLRDLSPGTYYIELPNPFVSFTGSYDFYFSLSPIIPDASEPNDISDDATPLQQDVFTYLQSIAPAGDDDWFVFTPVAAKQVRTVPIIIETAGPMRSTTLTIFNRIGSEVTPTVNQNNRVQAFLTPNEHFVRVREVGDDESAPSYGIVFWNTADADPFEDDDTPQTATFVTIDGPLQTHNLVPDNDEDWFRMFAEDGESMSMSLPDNSDARIEVFDDTAENLLQSTDSGFLGFSTPYLGTYFIRVSSLLNESPGDTQQYTLYIALNNAGANVVGTLSGAVTAPGKGTAIPNATVELTGAYAGSTTTDSTGTYVFPTLLQGAYTIEASANGYVTSENAIDLGGGANIFSFELDEVFVPEPEDLDGNGMLNAVDVQLIINAVLQLQNADVNNDGQTNASDIQTVINRVLAG